MFTIIIAVAVALGVILLVALMTAGVAASGLLAPGRILRLLESERSGAVSLDQLMDTPYRFRASAAITSAVAYTTVAVMEMYLFLEYTAVSLLGAALISALVSVVVVFSFGHALPRLIAVQSPERVALSFAPIALRVTQILYGPAKVLSFLWVRMMHLIVGEQAVSSPWISEDEYRFATPDDGESVREEAEDALLEAVSDFAGKVVREVMIPRTDMTCLPDTATAEEAIEVIKSAGYSRVPLYHKRLDNMCGVLYAKDLLAALSCDREVVPATIARRVYFVPETKPLQELLIEMRARTHIAIVADEYGGTAGLVTIEDLLEEIVGEIFDEYDLEVPLITESGDGGFYIDARLSVDDLNERFGTAITADSDTVGGVVIEAAGRIPQVGDAVEIEGLRFVVGDLKGTRIRQLFLEPVSVNHHKEETDA